VTIHTLLLFVHIIGSLVIGVLIVLTVYAIIQKRASEYRRLALGIAWSSAAQLITGSLLVVTQEQTPSLLVFCSKIGIYMSLVIASEALLFYRMRQEPLKIFPLRTVTSLFSIAMIMIILTITTVYE
jgi:hypothetical protein